jgi:hypothetical protein
MISASIFPRITYAQQGITGKGEQNILQSEENKVKADVQTIDRIIRDEISIVNGPHSMSDHLHPTVGSIFDLDVDAKTKESGTLERGP